MISEIFMDVAAALAELGEHHGKPTFTGRWSEKHWMNTPGPIYCGQSDNCGTGPAEAPDNVHGDAEGHEVIYRQPVNLLELEQVINAANCDPWGGYGADGNLHWTYETIKQWWAGRGTLIAEVTRLHQEANQSYQIWLNKTLFGVDFRLVDLQVYTKMLEWPEFADVEDPRIVYMDCERRRLHSDTSSYNRWKNFIQQDMLQYLQLYMFFLDHGRIAGEDDILPHL